MLFYSQLSKFTYFNVFIALVYTKKVTIMSTFVFSNTDPVPDPDPVPDVRIRNTAFGLQNLIIRKQSEFSFLHVSTGHWNYFWQKYGKVQLWIMQLLHISKFQKQYFYLTAAHRGVFLNKPVHTEEQLAWRKLQILRSSTPTVWRISDA
jgi:hypothetical protein